MTKYRRRQNLELVNQIRATASLRFAWENTLIADAKAPLENLESVVDVAEINRLAALTEKNGVVAVTFASKEYINVCANWIAAMKKLALNNYIVIAGDSTIQDALDRRGISHIAARFRTEEENITYRNPVGFTQKGLAMTSLKFPIVSIILKSGYSVIMSDLDAVWLRDPSPFLQGCDLAFQRVVYFPAVIARLWGFCACSGFVYFRRSPGTTAFVNACIREHRLIPDDQWAFNLALLGANVEWQSQTNDWSTNDVDSNADELIRASFRDKAKLTIEGRLDQYDMKLKALAHHEFWRHPFVTYAPSEIVVCHATSPKNDLDKINCLKAAGAFITTSAADSTDTTNDH